MTVTHKVTIIHSNNKFEEFDPSTLRNFLLVLSQDVSNEFLDIDQVIDKISAGLPDEIKTSELTDLVAEILASMTTKHYTYSLLASRVLISSLQNRLSDKFTENFFHIYNYEAQNSHFKGRNILSDEIFQIVTKHGDVIDEAICHSRDFDIDYFGFRTLQRSYFLKLDGKVHETPQYLFMRVALGIHSNNINRALETYHLMSKKYFIHASPTLFNAGLESSSLSSCYLVAMKDDSIDGIYKTLYDTAMISKSAGGVGLHISNIRSSGSYIAGTNGVSSGLVPLLKVFNATAKYVDQGGNKRPGAFCAYLEPWHGDIFAFLDLRKNHGNEEMRARDLFLALWIPDLFMERVESDSEWCLFSEDIAPGLSDCYGDEFNKLYEKYEIEGKFTEKIKARKLWHAILVAQTETGNPFLLYKDRCNKMSNQQNLGVIKSSNLCCEIVEYSSKDETAVCNLASLALPTFIENDGFNFQKLHDVSKVVVRNLDRIIDINAYPLDNCRISNMRNRPIGLGVQGLADVFFILRMQFGSEKSRELNIKIFETIYHAALEESCDLAKIFGKYGSFDGSPISKGLFQFDMWGAETTDLWDWDCLRSDVKKYGVRNSLLVALMPTASTSQILGFNECFEPITSNIYIRRVLSGEHQVVNKYLIEDLVKLGLWNSNMKDLIIANDGSIQNIDCIPTDIKNLYKTVWEISQKIVIDMAADRAPFVDQSQSMNLFLQEVTFSKLTSMHFYAWRKGLKTGMYYLRTKAAASAIQFSLDPVKLKEISDGKNDKKRIREIDLDYSSRKITTTDKKESDILFNIFDESVISCNLDDPENCDSCSA